MLVENVVVLLALWGVFMCKEIGCTSSQNLHNLLRHPHYADGHQHSIHSHSQQSTSYPQKRADDAKFPHSSTYSVAPTSNRARDEHPGPWNRVAPSKDYYKLNGYPVKSTSATKSSPMTMEPAELPQELLEVREANAHFVRMRSGTRCHAPRQQVVCVRDVYPDKEYLPKCTLLHRCTQGAGCCEEDTHCAPKAMQEVVLHFYVIDDNRSSDVEKLLFVNHTECECQPKPTTEVPLTNAAEPEVQEPEPAVPDADLQNNVVDHYPQGDQKSPKCRPCPTPLIVREHEDGRCSCDCFDRHKPCIRVKRGREALSDVERRCVLAGSCNVPDCDYGGYDPDTGRCPKKPDLGPAKAGEHGRRPPPNIRDPNHRWTYFERD